MRYLYNFKIHPCIRFSVLKLMIDHWLVSLRSPSYIKCNIRSLHNYSVLLVWLVQYQNCFGYSLAGSVTSVLRPAPPTHTLVVVQQSNPTTTGMIHPCREVSQRPQRVARSAYSRWTVSVHIKSRSVATLLVPQLSWARLEVEAAAAWDIQQRVSSSTIRSP